MPVSRDLLLVAPLSGHFPVLLRDLVIGLIPWFRVYVTDWINARHVGIHSGFFGLEDNIACVLQMMTRLMPGSTVVALCQGGIPTLAAAAILAATRDAQAPENVVLIAAPVDPLANPTRIVKLLRERSLEWMERVLVTSIQDHFEGRGRLVYPAHVQLTALSTYMARRIFEGGEMLYKILNDDGSDPRLFPFLDAYTSIMDLDARLFIENTKSLYRDCDLREGTMRFDGELVDLRAIRHIRLLTIEGEWDDIAAPGQTSAAHDLCTMLPERARRRIVVPRCGHFSLFHGHRWRQDILPEVLAFSRVQGGAAGAEA